MATAMLAYIRDDQRLWSDVGDWLRTLLQHYKSLKEAWAERFALISLGQWHEDLNRGNPRQYFESFTSAYWLEGGFIIMVLDLAKSYFKTAIAGLSPMNSPRGVSGKRPISINIPVPLLLVEALSLVR